VHGPLPWRRFWGMRSGGVFIALAFAASASMGCGSGGSTSESDGGGGQSDGDSASSEGGSGLGDDAALEASGPFADASLPPIDPNARIVTLTNMQLGELCDWMETQLGGYGQVAQCSVGSVQQPANQAVCVMEITFQPLCPVTVRDFETCIQEEAPSKGCVIPNQCVFQCGH
jgi:hypothetical protein